MGIWIAVDDQPFTITECQEFQEVIKLFNVNVEIPSADTVRNDILNLYQSHRVKMKNKLQVSIFFLNLRLLYKYNNLLLFFNLIK